jgi:two-component system, cell cycle response regulator DivK
MRTRWEMSKKVLIAEDYDDTRAMMRYLLQHFGYEVLEAADGQEAVDKAKTAEPDLILMDISMPVMDGLTATQIIRKCDGFATIPIIAVTAYGKSYYRQAIEAGCDDLINKPLDFDNLKPILEQYLAK